MRKSTKLLKRCRIEINLLLVVVESSCSAFRPVLIIRQDSLSFQSPSSGLHLLTNRLSSTQYGNHSFFLLPRGFQSNVFFVTLNFCILWTCQNQITCFGNTSIFNAQHECSNANICESLQLTSICWVPDIQCLSVFPSIFHSIS